VVFTSLLHDRKQRITNMAKTGGTQVKLPTAANTRGDDGYEDILSMMISSFSKAAKGVTNEY